MSQLFIHCLSHICSADGNILCQKLFVDSEFDKNWDRAYKSTLFNKLLTYDVNELKLMKLRSTGIFNLLLDTDSEYSIPLIPKNLKNIF